MQLTAIDANKNPVILQKVKDLYIHAFPHEERLPWWLLRLNSCRRDIDLTAWMDGDKFCGFTSSAVPESSNAPLSDSQSSKQLSISAYMLMKFSSKTA